MQNTQMDKPLFEMWDRYFVAALTGMSSSDQMDVDEAVVKAAQMADMALEEGFKRFTGRELPAESEKGPGTTPDPSNEKREAFQDHG